MHVHLPVISSGDRDAISDLGLRWHQGPRVITPGPGPPVEPLPCPGPRGGEAGMWAAMTQGSGGPACGSCSPPWASVERGGRHGVASTPVPSLPAVSRSLAPGAGCPSRFLGVGALCGCHLMPPWAGNGSWVQTPGFRGLPVGEGRARWRTGLAVGAAGGLAGLWELSRDGTAHSGLGVLGQPHSR